MGYIFGECTLDRQRCELRRAGRVSRLRRKAFQVLSYLRAYEADKLPVGLSAGPRPVAFH
jgi:DNA-binding winged helix-turn-helix (wHTH) protein